jgi:hypothetical protein
MAAQGELGLTTAANERCAAALFNFAKDALGLEADRMYLYVLAAFPSV